MNSSKLGQYYKTKTRKFLENYNGGEYEVVMIEKLHAIRRGRMTFYVKQDLLGGDCLAVSDKETIIANSVLGRTNISKHVREFEKHPSGGMTRIIVIWKKGISEPEVRNVDDGVRAIKPKKLKK